MARRAGNRIPKAGRFKSKRVRKGVNRLGRIQDRLADPDRNFSDEKRARLETRVGRLQDKFGSKIQRKQNRLDARADKLQGRIDSGNLSPKRTGLIQSRLDRVNKRNDRLGTINTPITTSNSVDTVEDVPEVVAPILTPEEEEKARRDYAAEISKIMQGLFPQTAVTDAQQYIQNSLQPTFDWEQEQGERALDRYYAAKGLTASGAEAEQNRRFQNELGATFRDRALTLASEDAERRQRAADRFYTMLNNEADRAQRGEENQFDNYLRTMELLTAQSPLRYGYDAAAATADLGTQYGRDAADIIAQLYARPAPATGGGGGGGSIPYIPPIPPAPSTTTADLIASQGAATTDSNLLGSGMDLISGLLGL